MAAMQRATTLAGFPLRLALGVAMMASCVEAAAPAEAPCHGHQLLSKPRPAMSCQEIVPQIYASPDGELRAFVVPAGVSLYATPDIESRVVIRAVNGDTLTSKDYSSPRGMNGYYVDQAKWSPDSQFFVYSMMSSGGHSPWSFPTWVYSRRKNLIAKVSDMIDGRPILSGDFRLSAPHTLSVVTWKREGDLDDTMTMTIDLETAFAKLPASSN
jgi:hypothetical protein